MSRVKIPDLLPKTNYVVQVRSVREGEKSRWSEKFEFETAEDTTIPKTPTNVTWVASGDSFVGEWDEVTKNLENRDVILRRYQVRMLADGQEVFDSVSPSGGGRVKYVLSRGENRAFFGTPEVTIQFQVRAIINKELKSDWSPLLTAGSAAPSPISNLDLTAAQDKIIATWSASPSADVAYYRAYIGTTPNFALSLSKMFRQSPALTATYNTATYSDHYVAITAVGENGLESAPVYGGPIQPLSPFGLDDTAPAVPYTVNVSSSGTPPSTATATWEFDPEAAGSEDIASFVVHWRKVGDTNWFAEYVAKDDRSVTVTLPQPYANYEFKVASIDNVANYSAFSPVATLSNAIAGPPPTPTNIVATAGMENVALSWAQSPHNDVVYGGYYEVNIATNSTFTTGLLTYKTGNNYISVSGLAMSTTYYYRVRAVDSTASASGWSATAQFTTDGIDPVEFTDNQVPSSSPAATVTPGIGVLHVSWPAITNNDLVTYEVHISVTDNFTPNAGTLAAKTPGTIVTLRNTAGGTALAYGTTYYVKILARDADGPAASAGTQGSGSPVKAGTADITTITADQIGAGSFSGGIFTVATGGEIRSADYDGSSAGWRIANGVFDIRSGTVAVGALLGGTITSKTITMGAGAVFNIDSTGVIKSNNYAPASTGWQLSSTGLEMNGGTIRSAAVVSPDITSGQVRLYNGAVTGPGFSLSGTGIYLTSGTIDGPGVYTNTIRSKTANGYTQSGVNFSINESGYTEIAGLKVYGNTIVGNSTAHWIQSGNWTQGVAGWRLLGNGQFELNGGTITGADIVTSATGHTARLSSFSGNSQLAFYSNGPYSGLMGGILALTSANDGIMIYGPGGFFNTGRIELRNGNVKIIGDMNMDGFSLFNMNGGDIINIGTLGQGGTIELNGTLSFIGSGNIQGVNNIYGGPTLWGAVDFNSLTGTNGERYVFVNNAGELSRGTTTSSREFKENIRNFDDIAETAVLLEPVMFDWKESEGGAKDRVGFIAEQADAIGLDQWTGKNDTGKATGFDYPYWVVAQQAVLRKHEEEIRALKEELQELRRNNANTTNTKD